jgi:ATP-dependent Lon protease
MAPVSPEASVARTFLDWVLALPWRETATRRRPTSRARARRSTPTTSGSTR